MTDFGVWVTDFWTDIQTLVILQTLLQLDKGFVVYNFLWNKFYRKKKAISDQASSVLIWRYLIRVKFYLNLRSDASQGAAAQDDLSYHNLISGLTLVQACARIVICWTLIIQLVILYYIYKIKTLKRGKDGLRSCKSRAEADNMI